MNLRSLTIKNVGSNWLALLSNLVLAIFLTPFILHRLGDEAFGLWVLVYSVTGYYNLFDFGIRSSIVKYVAQYCVTGEREELMRFVNTTLFVYSCISLLLLLLTGVGAWYVDSIFHISRDFVHAARMLFLLVGTAVALWFPLSVFSGILEGLQQFWWENFTIVISGLLRAILVVIALEHGLGLLTLALISTSLYILRPISLIPFVRRATPLQFGARFISRSAFQRMVSYGWGSFVNMMALQLRFRSDITVIGIFLSSAAITFYSIASKLLDVTTGVVDSLACVFLPMSAHLHAKSDLPGLQKIFVAANRACALIVFPACATLIILGKSFIEIWVGPKYVGSYVILLLLLVPKTLELAQGGSSRILFGIARHQTMAMVRLIEGVANLILSIVLLHYYGIVGVALGTAIPLLCTTILFFPAHLCKHLEMRVSTFLKEAYLAPVGLCAPLVATLLFLQHLSEPHSYLQLAMVTGGGAVVYGIGLGWFILTKDPLGVQLRIKLDLYLRDALN